MQIAVVDADDLCTGLRSRFDLFFVMCFDQRGHAERHNDIIVLEKLRFVKQGADQQHRGRAEELRLIDHVFVNGEILS